MSNQTYRDWGNSGYGDILNEALEKEPDRLVACPIDGTPLEFNDQGEANCPMGNYFEPYPGVT